MTAKQKIESLTHAWYGFTFASAVVGLLSRGIGVFAIVSTVLSLAVSTFIVWFIGRRLLARSGFTRGAMLVISTIGTLMGAYATAKLGYMFVTEWSLRFLVGAFFSGAAVSMYVRSFRTLTDSTVKAYFG